MAVITVSLMYYAAVLFCNICSSFGNTKNESYIGCFYDAYDPQIGSGVGARRVLPHAMKTLRNGMTIGTCFEFCSDETIYPFPMQYAGLETGNECWCGRAEARYDLYGKRDDSDCMVKYCSGNPSQYCGNDFRIAVYNLTLVRCQIQNIPGLDTSNPNFIAVYDNATFTCLPGYQLNGPDTLQCIFDDSITDIRWASDLPQCLGIPATISTTPITAVHSTTNSDLLVTNFTTNIGTTEMSSDMNYWIYIIGGVVGACIICVMICVLVILRSRSKRKTNQARQSNDMAMSSTSNGSTTKTQKDPPESSFPVYSQPIRPKSRGKSMMNETTATQEQTKPKTDETYSYADVHINPVTATASIDAVSNATQWAENNIYAVTEEPTEHEGWRDNNIYEAS